MKNLVDKIKKKDKVSLAKGITLISVRLIFGHGKLAGPI